jgi:septum formation protein
MLILASQSINRAQILNQSGVSHQVHPSGVDEQVIKEQYWRQGKTSPETSYALAQAKAEEVAQYHPEKFVLGIDQMVECEGKWFDKAQSIEEARDQLLFLAGRIHILPTSAVILYQGKVVWAITEIPRLTMRNFSLQFVDHYITTLDKKILSSVGCYQIEGLGVQLFEEIQGDIFTIMGLPLLPLLSFLRTRGLIIQ